MRESLLLAVESSYRAGICVVPPRADGSKAPMGHWKQYESRLSTPEEHRKWYASDKCTGIGWVCGSVSGNLEVLDFDNFEVYEKFKEACAAGSLADLVEKIESGYVERTPHGVHWPYRCADAEKNKVLAQRPLQGGGLKSIIETRGQGGYIIVAPSYGGVNADGCYERLRGSIETIAAITADERRTLHDMARLLCEKPVEPPRGRRTRSPGMPTGNRPGDIFARETTWAQILEPHGWVAVRGRGETTDWRRPGKHYGISATTNHMGSDCLWVFSSSVNEFEAGKSYTKFGAWAELNHNGDYEAATRELSEKYGIVEDTSVNFDQAVMKAMLSKNDRVPNITTGHVLPNHLLNVPGLLGEISNWITSIAVKQQPDVSLAAAIAMVATMIGRKTQTITRLKSNIYIIITASSGDGKEIAFDSIERILFEALGGDGNLVRISNLSSDSALINALMTYPCRILNLDEVGEILKVYTSGRASSYQTLLIKELTSIYGKSNGIYQDKEFADTGKEGRPRRMVIHPHLSLIGVTPHESFFTGIKKEHIGNGFIGRLLVFDTPFKCPHDSSPENFDIPRTIISAVRAWWNFKRRDDGENLDVEMPNPITVPFTADAKQRINEFSRYMTDHNNNLRVKYGEGGDGVYVRCATFAKKLSLIRACGKCYDPCSDHKSIVIDSDDAQWGIDLAWFLTDRFNRRIMDNVFDNQYERNVNLARRFIRLAGKNGIWHSGKDGLMKKTKLKSKDIKEAVDALVNSEEVYPAKERNEKNNDAIKYYYIY